jgi:hypothetical protein
VTVVKTVNVVQSLTFLSLLTGGQHLASVARSMYQCYAGTRMPGFAGLSLQVNVQ